MVFQFKGQMGIKSKSGQHEILFQMVYIAKRLDREKGQKIHMEDFCKLEEFQTEQKYNSSYERCGKLITKYCTNSGLDLVNYFELLVFSFLSGNTDMHMKNFSVFHRQGHFEMLASVLKIPDKTLKRILDKYSKNTDKVFKWIDQSFMSEEYNINYNNIWTEKLNRLM